MFTPETTNLPSPAEQIDINIPADGPEQVDLNAASPAQIPDEKTAGERATKAHIAFDTESPGIPQLTNELMTGNEEAMRQRLATAKDIAARPIKLDIIRQIASEKAAKGQALKDEEIEFIAGLSRDQLNHNPSTILETEFARQYFNRQATLNEGRNPISKGLRKDADATHDELDIASNIKTRQEIVKTGIQDLQQRWNATSWSSAIASHLGRFIPLLENIRLHDNKGESILPGANLDERRQRLWALPPEQFSARFKADVAELEALNPLTAMKYATAVLAYSSSDILLDNAFGVVDVATLPFIGTAKLAMRGAKGVSKAVGERNLDKVNEAIASGRFDVKMAVKDGVKADADPNLKAIEDIVEGAGDIETSATILAAKDASAVARAQDPLAMGGRMRSEIPSIYNIDRVMRGSKNLVGAVAARLREALSANAAALQKGISDTAKVINLEEGSEALEVGLQQAWAKLRDSYAHLDGAVMDVGHIRAEDNWASVHVGELKLGQTRSPKLDGQEVVMGKPDATLFVGEESKKQADFFARNVYKLNPQEFMIRQQGNGHYISVFVPVDETDPLVRAKLISTGHTTPVSFMNTFFGRGRTTEDTLSEGNRGMRHVATHGPQEMHRFAKQVADRIGDLPNKSKNKLQEMLQYNRDFQQVKNGDIEYGMFYKDVGQFDAAWHARFHTDPTEAERVAYFSAVQLNDWDWTFRNLHLYRDKARQGIEQFSFNHVFTDETSGTRSLIRSPFFDGKLRKDLPWKETEDFGILHYDAETGTKTYIRKNAAIAGDRAEIEAQLAAGSHKVIQVANPVDGTLRKLADTKEAIHFVVVPDYTKRPLTWNQLPYKPGGHREYQYTNWVKQPKMRKTEDGRFIHEGDQAIFNQGTEAEAKKFASAMDTARIMLKDGKVDDLEKFLPDNLPYTLGEFTKMFSKQMLKDGTELEPRLSLTDPIRHTVSGQNVFDIHKDLEKLYPNFESEIRSSYNLYSQIDKKYTSERDMILPTVAERMSGGKPLFALEPSKLIDPLNAMNRGISNAMRSHFLGEYKTASVERFIQEFGEFIKVEGKTGDEALAELRKNPVFYLHNAEFITQTPKRAELAAAKNAQRAILYLIGTESEIGQNLGWAQRRLMDFIYQKAGQGASNWVADHLLPTVQDPFRYMRAVAFHSKLGLFNPVQLFLQAQTLTHITAIAGPVNAAKGLAGYAFMQALRMTENPKIIESFADKATKLGWKKDEFLESYAAMKRSGIFNVEGEVAIRDDVFDAKLFQGVPGKFLNKGTFFFREGERMTRVTAWNAAYLEWKAANAGKALDNKALTEILLRQNTLSVNMTRASSASWQQGIMSVPTQFFGYQARLMEQFLGKRLTNAEKARAFITYSAMYGVPTAVGGATAMWPWYEDVRQAALERGMDVDAPGMRMLMEGIPSTMFSLISGNEQNFAQRMGPGGIQYFKNVFQQGKIIEIFGASPKIVMQMAGAISPVLKGVVAPFVPGMADWETTQADIINAFEEVSTLNNFGKAIYAWNTGTFMSKNETNLGPASKFDAIAAAMLGTQPLRITDAFIMGEMATEQAKMQEAVKKSIIKDWRRAMREFDAGNDGAAQKHITNMNNKIVGGGFRPDQLPDILLEASKGYENLVDKAHERYLKGGPNDQYQQRWNRFMKVKPEEK